MLLKSFKGEAVEVPIPNADAVVGNNEVQIMHEVKLKYFFNYNLYMTLLRK